MNNLASSLIKIMALAGGAIIGALLTRWLEETLSERERAQSEHDRTRYERGLSPIERVEIQPEEP